MANIENDNKKRFMSGIIYMALSLLLVCFFSKITPLIIYNADDWWYMGTIRLPFPQWAGWEPSRIFPEVAMPLLTGRFAAYIIYPITGDYVFSVTLATAIVMTILIVFMCLCMQRVLVRKYNCSKLLSMIYTGIFLVSFFLMFRNRSGSKYLFYSADLCTAYFYTMSGIINAILTLSLFSEENATDSFKRMKLYKKVLFCLFIYFAMFSNLFHSAITAVYCGTVILFDLIKERSLLKSLKKNLLQVSIVLVWFIVLAFEYSGGRSDSFEQGIDLALSFRQFMTMIGAMSIAYKIIVLLSVIGFIWLLRMKKDVGILPMIIVSGILETAFLLLLNAKVHYMSRVEASWGTWFYLILFCVTVFVYVCKSVGAELDNNIGDDLRDKVFWGSLLTLLIMIVFSWYPDGKFAISSTRNPDYDQCYDTSSYIFNSIVDADRAGQTEMVLKLPKSDRADEFTFVPQIGNTVSNSLYLQGIISHKINVTEEFDESLNERFLPKE